MENILEIKNLCKSYEKTSFTLDDITFSIPKGTIMGFVGKNGAGKTTTINSILNIVHKDSGSIKIFGEEMEDNNPNIRNDIAVVFDASNFSNTLTPRKIEKVTSDIYENWNKGLFFSLLQKFDILPDKKIKTFSRGMTMKLSIAVALSHGAKFLILDEATAGLDPVAREEILDIFLEFMEEENHGILISSHITNDLEKIADYITYISHGRIILTEKKDTLLYEYGIARCKTKDFEKLDRADFISYRKRGLQVEILVSNKEVFSKKYPHILVDHTTIDEILILITKEVN